jgi:hypothetical protein
MTQRLRTFSASANEQDWETLAAHGGWYARHAHDIY